MVEKTMSYTSTLKEYLILTKPGIVTLVLITTLGGFYIGSKGVLDPWIVFWTLLGTGLAAAGSAVLNMVLDKDIDSLMERTSERTMLRTAEPAAARPVPKRVQKTIHGSRTPLEPM